MNGKKLTKILEKLYDISENSKLLQSVRNGLVMLMPILLIGSFSIVLQSFPVPMYQNLIHGFGGGALYKLFSFLHDGTLGFFGVYLTVAISICYSQQYQSAQNFNYGPAITALICFCIFSGILQKDFTLSAFGVQGAFTAIFCALSASALYCKLEKRILPSIRLYADGIDAEFNRAIATFFPMILVVLLFASFNTLLVTCFHVTGFQMLFSQTMNHVFENMGRSLGTLILFLVLVNVMWFFGIHGNDVLEPISQHLFVPAIEVNQQLLQSGAQATEIFSKTFYDNFALMGGSGNTISLFLALLLFSKRRSNRKLAYCASVPMLINVNEILVFGLPIVFNPFLLVPFILTPIVLVLVSTLAMQLGLVPIPVTTVEWTTPILLGGYLATGSLSGAVLQVVNIVIGVLIYRPFVKLYDEEKRRGAKKRKDKLVHSFKQNEEEDKQVQFLALKNDVGNLAKELVEDMQYRLDRELPRLFYQPQFDHKGNCIGAEALLRWEHATYGTLFPPLVVKLATEAGMLERLEKRVFESVVKDLPQVLEPLSEDARISVNVTGVTIQKETFEKFLQELSEKYPQYCSRICIEITEQTALKFDTALIHRLKTLQARGFSLAIDDFSMGSTSIKYLQTNVFDMVKLDGAISRDVLDNARSREIIASITALSHTFGIHVLAEYVETEEQRKALEEIGCFLYQGYLYSPAVPVEEFEKSIRKS